MSPSALVRELELARHLAREAGAIILEHYAAGVDVEFKDPHGTDPVTAADHDANEVIVAGLRDNFGGDGILAEESRDSEERLSRTRLWCVDPLDGTREFVDRNGQFVVMIGLAVNGVATLGVVYQPTEDILWWGVPGQAVEERGSESRALRVTATDNPAEAVMMVSRSHRSQTVTGIAQRMGLSRQEPLGSVGLKVSRIITGSAELYVSTTDKTKEWDACAPEAIIKAAGGQMTDVRGKPLGYNKTDPNTPYGMLASNGVLHARCVEACHPVLSERGWT